VDCVTVFVETCKERRKGPLRAARAASETSSFVRPYIQSGNVQYLAVRSKAGFCGRSLAGIAVSSYAGVWMFVCCECCVLSGRGLCIGLITRPEEYYRMCFVCVYLCVLEERHTGGLDPRW